MRWSLFGGCAAGLLLTDPAAPPIRVTQDVDVITEVTSLADYQRLSKQLRKRGFKEDQSTNAPVCRWVSEAIMLDVMPTDQTILGFGNAWYQTAMENSQTIKLPSGKQIALVTAPCFLATKLDAFKGRGLSDYVMSHDMEDIISVLDGRPEIMEEVKHCGDLWNVPCRTVHPADQRRAIHCSPARSPAR